MLSGLAADKCTACLNTAFSHTAYDGSYFLGYVLAACDIVKEKHGTCAAADDVVYTHSYAVNTYGIMLVHQECQLDLCTNTVGTADEYGLLHTGDIGNKESSETSDIRGAFRCFGPGDAALHELHCLVACGDVNTGCLVAFAETVVHGFPPFVRFVL